MNATEIAQYVCLFRQMCKLQPGPDPANPRFGTYLIITEGRVGESTPGQNYGWCGDAVTYTLSRKGCDVVEGSILNRAEINGSWQAGDNLNRIENWAIANGFWVTALDPSGFQAVLEPGDLIFLTRASGGHICSFLEWTNTGAGIYTTMDGNSFFGVANFRTGRNVHTPIQDAGGIRGVVQLRNIPTQSGAGIDSLNFVPPIVQAPGMGDGTSGA